MTDQLKNKEKGFFVMKLQSTRTTLGTSKKCVVQGGRSLEVFQSKLVIKIVWPELGWSLLTGGSYSEVAVNTGLTVLNLQWPFENTSESHLIEPDQINTDKEK